MATQELKAIPSWLKTGKEIYDLNIDKVPTLLAPFIPKVGAISLAGSSDLGKSYFLLQLMTAVVTGRTEFLGFQLQANYKAALYLSTEDDDYSLCPRLQNMIDDAEQVPDLERLKVIYETKDLVKRLEEALTAFPSDLVVIDTFSDIFDGDMNQANKVRSYLQPFKELAIKHKTVFIFNHHCGKKNDFRPPHKDNLLGSQGFESSMRCVIELRKDFADPYKRHLCVVKGNYVSEEYKNESFVLEFDYIQGFTNTGQRVPFDSLAKTGENLKVKNALEQRIGELLQQGLTVSKIHGQLVADGFDVSRSKVGNICQALRPSIQRPQGAGQDESEVQGDLFIDIGEEDLDNEAA